MTSSTAAGLYLTTGCSSEPNFQEPDFSTLTFGLAADVQYCDYESQGIRHYRQSIQKLSECVDDLNQRDLPFVIHLGDVVDRDIESFAAILPVFNQFRPPLYHVLGNHDYEIEDAYKETVHELLGLTAKYYDVVKGPWRFIVLDGNDLSITAHAEGSYPYAVSNRLYQMRKRENRYNAKPWNGAIGDQQMEWLKKRLALTTHLQQKAIIICHFPIVPENSHNLWNDNELYTVISGYDCVVAYMNGHNHAGNYGERDGIHFINFKGMVDTDNNAYAIVRLDPQQITITGVGREESRVLKLRTPTSQQAV